MEITCTSNGRPTVPASRRNSPSRASRPGTCAGSPPAVQPAVPGPGGTAEGGVPVTTDEDRQGLTRHGCDLDRRQVEDLPVILEVPPGRQPAHDGQRLVHAPPAMLPGHPEYLVILAPRARPHPQDEPVAGENGRRRRLLGHQHRVAHRQLQNESYKTNTLGNCTQGGNEREGLDKGLVLKELTAAVVVERVPAVGAAGVADAVGH